MPAVQPRPPVVSSMQSSVPVRSVLPPSTFDDRGKHKDGETENFESGKDSSKEESNSSDSEVSANAMEGEVSVFGNKPDGSQGLFLRKFIPDRDTYAVMGSSPEYFHGNEFGVG
jgi:hypothetical protein